jgi:rfaE bifunctional protein nucleotidyltransferase chain/domain
VWHKLVDPERLVDHLSVVRTAGQRVVFTNGCFDVLHRGHVEYLAAARALGDLLMVAVNDDGSVRGLKGPGRPVNPLEDRCVVLAGLTSVDLVVPFSEPTPVNLVARVRPEVYVKGGDYRVESLPEAAVVAGYGGEVRILPYVPGRSTTEILQRWRVPSST